MIPESAPYVPTAAENESVRQARESFLTRHSALLVRHDLDVQREGPVVDIEERVAIRESKHEFRVVEANGLVRLFILDNVDSEGKSHWLSKYVGNWLDADSAIDDLIAMAAA